MSLTYCTYIQVLPASLLPHLLQSSLASGRWDSGLQLARLVEDCFSKHLQSAGLKACPSLNLPTVNTVCSADAS